MDTNFREYYARISDNELLHVARDRRDLREEAVLALDAEMARRGLTDQQARARSRDDLRAEIGEVRKHGPKRNKSKYFVAQLNLRAYLVGLLGLVLLMFITLGHHRLPEQVFFPLLVIYIGTLMACLVVQPWVRRTFSFWISLVISWIPQLLVSHWLAVHHPAHSAGETKGSGFLSMFAGYVLGVGVFIVLQKLKRDQPTGSTR